MTETVSLVLEDGAEMPQTRGRWLLRRGTGYRPRPMPRYWVLEGDTFIAATSVEWPPTVRWGGVRIAGFRIGTGKFVPFDDGPSVLRRGDTLRVTPRVKGLP